MTEEPELTRTVRLRLISQAAPPKEYDNRPTEFGLKDRKRHLHRGLELPDGSVQFDLEIQFNQTDAREPHRFRGRFVLGKSDEQFIGLIWNFSDTSTTIRGQKIRLDTLTWQMIDKVTGSNPGILQTTIVPIMQKTATVPVEWTAVSASDLQLPPPRSSAPLKHV